MSTRVLPVLIFLLTLAAVWVSLPSANFLPDKLRLYSGRFPLKLGLDLQGGTELILQTQMESISQDAKDLALESAKEVIERRVNLYGISEAVVRSSRLGEERRILVELPGVKNTDEAVKLVGTTALLEFRQLQSSPSAESSPSAFVSIENTSPTSLTGADLKKAQVGFGAGKGVGTGVQVEIEFTEKGADKFAAITKGNIGKPLPIFLDGIPISAPIVQQEIIGGRAIISGQFDSNQAKSLAVQLNAGALPVPIKVLHQKAIAATLGQASIQKSIFAAFVGIITVMVFMVLFYGIYGLVANIALLIYSLLTLAIFRTGLFILPPVTLTLAGLAGFILSIGMAVDANILIFERTKEELRAGKNNQEALRLGFKRAWVSIRDSNVSSLITAAILFGLGTSIVRGFALTLAIGVVVSMFSAITVSRMLLSFLPKFRR